MNRYSTYLKTKARITLQGRYGIFIGGLLLIALVSMLLNMLPVSLLGHVPGTAGNILRFLLSFAVSLFTSMLLVGLSRMAMQACRGQEIAFSDLFYAFSRQSDRLLLVRVILALMTLVLEVPYFFFDGAFLPSFCLFSSPCGFLCPSIFSWMTKICPPEKL